jgi:hypothetical protein
MQNQKYGQKDTKTSEQWFNEFYRNKVTILDADGWPRDPDTWEFAWKKEQITKQEFERRLNDSTLIWNTGKL